MALQSRADIEAAQRAAQGWLPHARDKAFVRGAMAAYEWVLGTRATAPASESAIPATEQALLIEEQHARRLIYSSTGSVQSYSTGVENALMWCRCATEDAPVPLDRIVA